MTRTMILLVLPVLLPCVYAQQPSYSWRGIEGTGVFPANGLVSEFWDVPADYDPAKAGKGGELPAGAKPDTQKNIVWRATLPHWGHNAPVVVGDRVFLLTAEGWKSDCPELVCLDVKDGKMLWQKPVDHMDAWPFDSAQGGPAGKAVEGKKWRAKNHEYWRQCMGWFNRIFWDNQEHKLGYPQPRGQDLKLPADRMAELEKAKAAGFDFTKWRGDFGASVAAGIRSRYYWEFSTPDKAAEHRETYNQCNRNRYYWYPGWSSEGPFFGATMGSVVSDGKFVYAVTALDAAVCYDFEGNRKWVTDLDGARIKNYPASAPGYIQNHMASPVLADGKLIYFHRDTVAMYGLEAATGRILWKTVPSGMEGVGENTKVKPANYSGHMGPGGTPVVMRMDGTTVVVSGHGMVVRVADGKMLGLLKAGGSDADAGNDDDPGGMSSYNSWAAAGDVLYAQTGKAIRAFQLKVSGDTLGQEVLWSSPADVRCGAEDTNLTIFQGRVHGGTWGSRGAIGFAALDAKTGRLTLRSGGRCGRWNTAPGCGLDKVVLRAAAETRYSTYTIHDTSDLKKLGTGFLAVPTPGDELRDRHIALMGTSMLNWGAAGITAWGNRIFIRNNDYLWCVGDPKEPWRSPEECLK